MNYGYPKIGLYFRIYIIHLGISLSHKNDVRAHLGISLSHKNDVRA